MTKTVPESKFTELQGLDRISPTVHEMKCLWREITKSDFGIDGEIELLVPRPDGKGYHVTGGILKVQAKSGSSYIVQDTQSSFAAKSSKDDFELWYKANFVTVFIIYHPGDDKLYWKEMKTYLESTPNVWTSPYKIEFDKTTDVFDANCVNKLRAIAKVSPPRVSTIEREKLFSNLLKVREMPAWVWSSPCKANRREDLWDKIPGPTPPFAVTGKRLYTLDNLNNPNCVFRQFCDEDQILKEPAEAFWEDEDRERQYVDLVNQLLGRHLRRRGIHYNFDFKRNYFPKEDNVYKEFKKSWFNLRTQRKAPSRSVCKYYEYGADRFWRHLAANIRFQRMGNSWFLQIIPMYFFTEDGVLPFDSEKVGSFTTRKKAKETNQHVMNHVLFWANTLTGLESQASTIKIWLDTDRSSRTQPIMVIEAIPAFGIADFAIPFDPATYQEEELIEQTSLFSFMNQQLVIEDDLDDDDEDLLEEEIE